MKLIDISGFGHSGKTAVSDLFREVKGVEAHDHSFEFGLLRLPDGILELEEALCGNWSPVRSDRAIKRFRRICNILNDGYSNNLCKTFLEDSEQYIESLVDDRLWVDGWFDGLYDGYNQGKTKEILKKFNLLNLARNLRKIFPEKKLSSCRKSEVFLSGGVDFKHKTKKFLDKILFCYTSKESKFVLTNNMLEPFSPSMGISFFEDAVCIVVQRDPRDVFASVKNYEQSFVPAFEEKNKIYSKEYLKNLKQDMLGSENLSSFITRQKLYHHKTILSNESDRIIRIKYEDLVLNYDDTVKKLFSQVGIHSNDHVMKKRFFDPNQSSKNVGIWKTLPDDNDIKKIENELEDLLYDIK